MTASLGRVGKSHLCPSTTRKKKAFHRDKKVKRKKVEINSDRIGTISPLSSSWPAHITTIGSRCLHKRLLTLVVEHVPKISQTAVALCTRLSVSSCKGLSSHKEKEEARGGTYMGAQVHRAGVRVVLVCLVIGCRLSVGGSIL